MALETLKGVKQIAGWRLEEVNSPTKTDYDPDQDTPIVVDHTNNVIAFKIQDGPIREVGLNGCQVTDMVRVAKHIIANLNEKYPSHENTKTLDALDVALMWQDKRTKDREARGVEGFSKK